MILIALHVLSVTLMLTLIKQQALTPIIYKGIVFFILFCFVFSQIVNKHLLHHRLFFSFNPLRAFCHNVFK